MILIFLFLLNIFGQPIEDNVELDIYLGKYISLSKLIKEIIGKSQLEKNKISNDFQPISLS